MAIQQSTDGQIRELALFAGAGGGILGGHLLGWRTVCAVEREAYAAALLAQRQNDGILPVFPIWSDVTTFDGRPWRGRVDVISGGFPCQDISTAGKGAGIEGARSGLWGEFARIIGEVRPRYVFVENSPALTSRGLGRVLGDLAAMGFDARWGVLGAIDLGAPHRRDRIWIVAYSMHGGYRQLFQSEPQSGCEEAPNSGGNGKTQPLADSECKRRQGGAWERVSAKRREAVEFARCGEAESIECEFCGYEFPAECGRYGCPNCEGEGLGDSECKGLERHSGDGPQGDEQGRQSEEPGRPAGPTSLRGWINQWPSESGLGRVVDELAYRLDLIGAYES